LPGLTLTIDPDDSPLALTEANGFAVLAPAKFKLASREKLWASNIDTEGERPAGGKVSNAEITPPLRLFGATEEQFRARQLALDAKYNKLEGEGGVLRITLPDGDFSDWEIFDIARGEKLLDNSYVSNMLTEDELTFITAPFGESPEELVGEFEGEDRVLECILEDIGGTAEALARVELLSPVADIFDLKWGRDSRSYSAAETAEAYYPATALTPLGGATATTATIEGKASTPIVRQGTLTPGWAAQLGTDIAGVGPMTHEGVYEVLVWIHMPATNTGAVEVRFEYGVGEGTRTELTETAFAANHSREGRIIQLSVGQAFLRRRAQQGDHGWDGRFLTRSTIVGDDFDILGVGFRPLEEGRGEVSVTPQLVQPSALVTRDEFNQGAGALHGKGIAAAGTLVGPKSPGTLANDAAAGTAAWSNPSNAASSNNSYATAAAAFGEGFEEAHSQILKATNFGFAIPSGSVINGIVATIEGKASAGPAFLGTYDEDVRLVKGGVIGGANHAAGGWPPSEFIATYGSNADLWGLAFAHSDINAANFGIAYRVGFYSAGGSPTVTHFVDHITLTVYYTDPAGQTWSTTGDATDFAVETTGKTAQRTEVSDAEGALGRYAVAGSTVLSDVVAGIKAKRSTALTGGGERLVGGVLARYTNTSNWLFFGADVDAASAPVKNYVAISKRVAGTVTELGRATISDSTSWRQLWLQVDRRGRFFCWGALAEGGAPALLLAGQDNDLATGGALDDGTTGFYDVKTGALANTRNYDDFVAWIPPLEAVGFASHPLVLAHDRVEREGLGGSWTNLTPAGDYLRLAPAGMEGRKNRLVLIASPNDPETMGVGFPIALKAAVYVKRRWRTIPDPS